jgi:PAS domain S-box-containing protein
MKKGTARSTPGEMEIKARLAQLTALHKTLLDITAQRDLTKLLQAIVQRAARLLKGTSGGLYLCDAEKQECTCVVSYKTPRDYTGTVLRYGEGAAGKVAASGQPLLIEDYRAWEGHAKAFESEQPFRAVLAAPLLWHGGVTGVIDMLREQPFTQADLELLTMFASQAAIAIENARELEAEGKQVDEALRESEARFRIALENSPIVVFNQDRELRYTWVYNPHPGFDPQALLGKTDAELLPADDAARLAEIKRRVLETGVSAREEVKTTIGGQAFFYDLTVEPLRDLSGNIIGVTCASLDITERKQAEYLKKEREKELRILYGLSRIIEREGITLDEVYQELTNILPAGWQYPEITYARIVMGDSEFRTENFTESAWKQSAPVKVKGSVVGRIEVGYLEQKPKEDEGPFLKEERQLIDSISEWMGRITEHKRAEEEIKSLAKFPSENPNPILRIDQEGILLYANQAAFLFLADWNLKIGQAVPEVLRELMRETFVDQRVQTADIPCGERVFSVAAAPITETGYINLYIQDVTERKRAENELLEMEEKYHLVVENATMTIVVAQDGMIKFFNPEAIKITGYSQEELASKPFAEFIHPDDQEVTVKYYLGFLKGDKTPPIHTLRIIDKEGSFKWLESNAVLITWEGRPATLNFLSDITGRQRSEEALRKSEDIFNRFMEFSPIYIFFKDENIRALRLSKNYETMLGKPIDELLGKNMDELFPSELAKNMVADDMRILKEGKTITVEEELNGRFYTTTKFPIHDEGKTRYLAGYTIDITERKLAKADMLLDSEIFKNVAEGIYLIGLDDGIIKYANPIFEQMFGYEPGEMIGKYVSIVNAPTDKTPEETKEQIVDILKSTNEWRGEVNNIKKDGTPFWCYANCSLFTHPEYGKVIVAVHTDITERKRAEETLRESEEKYRTILENMEEGYYEVDIAGNYTFFNESVCRLLGYSREEMMGMNNRYYTDKTNAQKLYRTFNEVYRTGVPAQGSDWELIRKDNTKRYVECSVSSIKNKSGQPIGFRGIIRDITERKQAEEALRQSEAKLKALFETLPVGVSILDAERKISFMNPALERILDISRERLLKGDYKSRTYLRLDRTPMPAKEYASVRAFKEQRVVHNVETGVVKEDGNVIWVSVSAVPVAFPDWKVVVVTTDLTERLRAEESLRASEARYHSLFEDSPIALFEQDFFAVKHRLEALHNQGVTDFWAFFEEHPEVVTECLALIKVKDMNKAALKLYGASSKAELQAGLNRLVPADAYSFQEELVWIAEGRAEYEWEGVNQTLAGERIDIHMHLSAVPGHEDTMAKVLVSIDNITGRKRAEKALKMQAQVLDSMVEGVSISERNGILINFNPAFEIMFGYTHDELLGKHMSVLFGYAPEENLRRFSEIIVQLRTRGTWFGEISSRKKDGTPFTTYARFNTLETLGEKYWISVQEDITERKRVEEAEREQRALAEALCDTAAALGSTLHLDEVLDRILANVSHVVPYDSVSVMLVESGVASIARHQGYPERLHEEFARSLRFTLDDTATLHHMVETGMPLIIPDTQTYPQWVDIPETRWIRSYAGVPIRVKGETVGFLNLNSVTPGFYTPAYAEGLQAFASQVAVAIENARMYEEIKTRRRYLETLLQVNATLRSTLPLNEVLSTITRGTGETLGYVGSLILLPDAMGDRLIVGAAWGGRFLETAVRFTKKEIKFFNLPLTARENPIARAYLSGEIQSWSKAPERIVVGIEPAINPKLASLIEKAMAAKLAACVPLLVEEKKVGVLVVFSPREQLQDEERAMLLGLANQAGLAIASAQLFEEVRAGRERLHTLSRQLVEAQEVERRHIARELHDEIGQDLTGLKLALEISALSPAETVKARLDEAKTLIGELVARVRELSLDLRPGMLDDLGLLPALLWHFERYTAQTKIQVNFKCTGLEGQRFPPEVETAAYRIVQEALTNVARHAGVGLAAVRLRASQDTLSVQIKDQGIGFNSEAALASGDSSGLAGMCERAALCGGQLTVESTPGVGTRVVVKLPLAEQLERRTIERLM